MAEPKGEAGKADPSLLHAWVNQQVEEVIDPDLPIIDAHHHLRDYRRPGPIERYLFEDLLRDISSGHNIRATVVVECSNMYRATGSPELRCVGETEFLNGIAAMFASGLFGPTRGCAAIVGYAELSQGSRVADVLDAQIAAAGGRFQGIRSTVVWDDAEVLQTIRVGRQGLIKDAAFRQGYMCLAPRGLVYEAWVYHPQLPDVLDLAHAFPDSTIVINHCGGPIAIGPYAEKRDEVFAFWVEQLRKLAHCRNVFMKLGALGSPRTGFAFEKRDTPASSAIIAEAWKPYIESCIEIFGPARCMFESNFPPDKVSCSYTVIWNAFKRIAASHSETEKDALFRKTAANVYRLNDIGDDN